MTAALAALTPLPTVALGLIPGGVLHHRSAPLYWPEDGREAGYWRRRRLRPKQERARVSGKNGQNDHWHEQWATLGHLSRNVSQALQYVPVFPDKPLPYYKSVVVKNDEDSYEDDYSHAYDVAQDRLDEGGDDASAVAERGEDGRLRVLVRNGKKEMRLVIDQLHLPFQFAGDGSGLHWIVEGGANGDEDHARRLSSSRPRRRARRLSGPEGLARRKFTCT